MPTRFAKSYSDRGRISNLSSVLKKNIQNHDEVDIPFTPSELRIKKLYDYSQLHRDTKLAAALGFITTNYIDDKNALGLSIYRLRKIVEEISAQAGSKIFSLKNQLEHCFSNGLSQQALNYIKNRKIIKQASNKPPVFRRVSGL